ncbi:MAG TPA: amidohydrolase [Panacibacter sp.]|nr:amidohydrolase [Panacibacter sp.]HNP45570.1 amidohydrolase [Panacibacter sp.]
MNKILLIATTLLNFAAQAQQQVADKIYVNAKIWTGDDTNKWAKTIALKNNTIIYVGNDYKSYTGNKTIVTDLEGRLLIPGFIDNHTHFLAGGFQLVSIDLRQVKSKKAFIQTFKKYVQGLDEKRWITGGDWDHEAWGGDLPKKEWIDAVSGNHPVFVNRYDGHMALANSVALRLAGIDKNTSNPPGGEIVKDPATGEPTGVLRDEAMNLVNNVIPEPSAKEMEEAFLRAQQHALSLGVTQVHDMSSFGGWPDMNTYQRAYADDQLQMRVYSFVALATWQKLADYVTQNGRGDDMLRWGGLKGFVDGSLGSTTAWFYKPYLDAPNSTGLQVTDTTLLHDWVIAADKAGLQVATHAIGDRANDFILNVYKEANTTNGTRDRRFRIEHAQHLTQEAITRFGVEKVIPSMQPYHAIDDGKWAAKRLDDTRLRGTYAFNSLLKDDARLTFGTDWTVAPLNPLLGIYAAVTRRTLDNKNPNGWYPQEKITVEQAMKCYTANNAYAGFQENKLGILKAGMLADFAVLDKNIFSIDAEQIRNTKVVLTVVNGKEVYKAKQ